MTAEHFTWLFVIMLGLGLALELWLSGRQVRHVRRHRDTVPDAFAAGVSAASHRKASEYTIAKTHTHMFEAIYAAMLVLLWTLGGGLDLLAHLWGSVDAPLWRGTGVVLSVLAVMGLLDRPLEAYRAFVVEQHFGFNRTTPAVFVADTLKGLVLLLVLGVPLAAAVLWCMSYAGPWWWLLAWVVWTGFSLLMMWAFPTLIAPLFNKFTPLDDAALRTRIEELLQRCGFTSRGVYVMDGSRRSGHGNAYFTGLGTHKRIVFFDTLMHHLEPTEIEAVLAHELGHYRRRHVQKRLLASLGLSLVGLALLGWLAGQSWFYAGLGLSAPSDAGALILFLLVGPVLTFFLRPVAAALSRRHELQADEFAAAQVGPKPLAAALGKLYRDNAATLSPDPWYSAFHDSHPPAAVRIAHLQGLALN